MTPAGEESKRRRIRYKRRARAILGFRCCVCFSNDFQFAHRDKAYKGDGRGSKERYLEVLRNPNKIIGLCEVHHQEYDHINTVKNKRYDKKQSIAIKIKSKNFDIDTRDDIKRYYGRL